MINRREFGLGLLAASVIAPAIAAPSLIKYTLADYNKLVFDDMALLTGSGFPFLSYSLKFIRFGSIDEAFGVRIDEQSTLLTWYLSAVLSTGEKTYFMNITVNDGETVADEKVYSQFQYLWNFKTKPAVMLAALDVDPPTLVKRPDGDRWEKLSNGPGIN